MTTLLPSQIVEAVEAMFGVKNEICSTPISPRVRALVHALLALVDEVPAQLVDLPACEYRELKQTQDSFGCVGAGDRSPEHP
jgi:hypothetical protein